MSINTFKTTLRQQLQAGGSETTIYLNSITTVTGEEVAMTDFLPFTRGIITVDPENDTTSSSRPEFISFTGLDAATKTLTGATRGLSAKSNSEITANKTFHPVDSPVIISFGAHNMQDFIDYIDNEVGSLTLGTNAITTAATAGETIASSDLVYLKESDGRWWKVDADTEATVYGVKLAIAQGAGTAGNAITGGVITRGRCTNFTGLTANTRYYASNTAGGISTSAGTISRVIGYSLSTTVLEFDPDYNSDVATSPDAYVSTSAGAGDAGKGVILNAEGLVDPSMTFRSPVLRTYLNAGSPHTWTKPTGLKYIIVEVQGGGGNSSTANTSISDGGGGGGYSKKLIAESALGATETVTVGGATQNSTFGAHCTGNGGATPTGGGASGGDINIPGSDGSNSSSWGTDSPTLGWGGGSFLGGMKKASTNNDSGGGDANGQLYGGGAGPAVDASDSGTSGGSTGAAGIVIVTEYYN